MTCAWGPCGVKFPPSEFRPWKRYCSARCQRHALRDRRLKARAAERALRPDIPKPKPNVRRPRASCKWCGGRHTTDKCKNRDGSIVRQYGTLGPNREYVPPEGVKVRVLIIPNTVHGDTLGRMLKEMKR